MLHEFEAADLAGRCRRVVAAFAPELLHRALGYLYTKETKSSFAIEQIRPGSTRIDRFVALLKIAEEEEFCGKPQWVRVQNRVVDARFIETDYRSTQNYVGETVAPGSEKIHFIGPKPENLEELMEGLAAVQERLRQGGVPPVIQAAVIAYGFVFLHPFEDGNGRIHRFLIHNLLARRGFTPRGVMFPVSASMLKNPADYDASLEAFSRQLRPLVDYSLDEGGRMTVHNDTALWYRYLDLTPQTEALFRFIAKTIETELPEELTFLVRYDRAKKAVQEIVDLPDRQIDLFIRFCHQNRGRLADRKRLKYFEALSDEEIIRLESVVQKVFGLF
jgi:hypothetical protein